MDMTFLFQKVKSQNSWFRFTERFHHRIQRKKAVFVMHSHKILTGFYILQVFRFMILIADLLSILNLTTESLPGPSFIFTVQQKFSNRKQFKPCGDYLALYHSSIGVRTIAPEQNCSPNNCPLDDCPQAITSKIDNCPLRISPWKLCPSKLPFG